MVVIAKWLRQSVVIRLCTGSTPVDHPNKTIKYFLIVASSRLRARECLWIRVAELIIAIHYYS
jgi:hypothetical protein